MEYISRKQAYEKAVGVAAREGGKCSDAWALFAMAHRHGVTDLKKILAAGALIEMNANNLMIEHRYRRDTNAHLFGETSKGLVASFHAGAKIGKWSAAA